MKCQSASPDEGVVFRPVRRISTVFPVSFLAEALPIPVPPGRLDSSHDSALCSSTSAALSEIAAALASTSAAHVRPLSEPTAVQGSPGGLVEAILRLRPDAFNLEVSPVHARNKHASVASAKQPAAPARHAAVETPKANRVSLKKVSQLSLLPRSTPLVPCMGRVGSQDTGDAGEAGARVTDILQQLTRGVKDVLKQIASESEDLDLADLSHDSREALRTLVHGARHKLASHLTDAALEQVPPRLASRTFQLLGFLLPIASSALIHPGDQLDSESGVSIQLSLQSAMVLLQLMACSSCPRQLLDEALFEHICGLLQHHLLRNLAAFHSKSIRAVHRPQLDDDRIGGGSRKRGGDTAFTYLATNVCAALDLVEKLCHNISLRNQKLSPLVAAATEILNIPELQLMHNSVTGFVAAVHNSLYVGASGHSAGHLDPALLQLVLPIVAEHGSQLSRPQRIHPLGDGVKVQATTLLLLRLVQTSARFPPLGSSAAELDAFFKPTEVIVFSIWQVLLAGLGDAAKDKSSTGKDLLGFVQALVDDLAALLPSPEWPAAELLVNVLARVLGHCYAGAVERRSSRGGGHKAVSERDASLAGAVIDLGGYLVANVLTVCQPSHDDRALLMRLLSHQSASTSAAADGDAEVGLLDICKNEDLIRALLLTWLHNDAGLDDAQAESARLFASSLHLSTRIAHVHLNSHAAAGQSPRASVRPDDSHDAALQACHDLLRWPPTGLPAPLLALVNQVQLTRRQALSLGRMLLAVGAVHTSTTQLLSVLAESCDVSRQPLKKVRTKGMRALATVVKAQPELLAKNVMKKCISDAIASEREDSAQVRDAALDILTQHLKSSSLQLRAQYYDLILKLTKDQSMLVRKRAIGTVWECFINDASCGRSVDALMAQLHMVNDVEKSVQDKVIESFKTRWFGCESVAAAKVPAAEMATIVARCVANGQAIPFSRDFGVLHLVTVIVRGDRDSARTQAQQRAIVQAGRCLAEALLEAVLTNEDVASEGGSGTGEAKLSTPAAERTARGAISPHAAILALLVLSQASIALLVPEAEDCKRRDSRVSDPRYFLDSLAVYLKPASRSDAASTPGAAGALLPTDPPDVEASQQLQASLLLVSSLLTELHKRGLEPTVQVLGDITSDLWGLLRSQSSQTVLSNICRCLATAASMSLKVTDVLCSFCSKLYASSICGAASTLREFHRAGPSAATDAQAIQTTAVLFRRNLHVLSSLLRHMAANPALAGTTADMPPPLLPGGAAQGEPRPIVGALIDLLVQVDSFPAGVRESMVGALGNLLVGHPDAIMHRSEAVLCVLRQALSPRSPSQMVSRMLNVLIDMVRGEESSRLNKYQAQRDADTGKAAAVEEAELAVANGIGEATAISSNIIGALWPEIAQAACYTHAPNGRNGMTVTPDRMRMSALILTELVAREGQLGPWIYYPTLIALTADENPQIVRKALDVLRPYAEKKDQYLSEKLADGLARAQELHRGLAAAKAAAGKAHDWDAVYACVASGLYAEVIRNDKKLRHKFLGAMVSHFKAATDPMACGRDGLTADRVRQLEFIVNVLAALPFTVRDDPLFLLFHINQIISRRADTIFSRIHESFEGGAAAGAENDAVDAAPNGRPATPTAAVRTADVARQERRAGVVLCMLLVLKRFLKAAYGIKAEVLAAYNPGDKKGERDAPTNKDQSKRLALDAEVDPEAAESAERMRKQFARLERLLAEDTDDYGATHTSAVQSKPRKGRSRQSAPLPDRSAALSDGLTTPAPRQRKSVKAATTVKRKRKRKGGSSDEED